jgi:TonB family protein
MTHLGPSLRRWRHSSRTWPRVAVGLVVSLLVNLLVLRLVHVDFVGIQATRDGARPVSLAPLSASEWAANRQVLPSRPGRPAILPPVVVPPPAPEPPKMPGQVVDVGPSGKDQAPKDSRFVSERNNTVEKETISRYRRPGYENVLPRPTQDKAPGTSPTERPVVAQEPGGDTRRPGAPGKPGPRPEPSASGEKLALNVDPSGSMPAKEDRRKPLETPGEQGQGGEGGAGAPRPKAVLAPSAAFYDKLSGGPAPDHVEDVDVGESTFLNTREWKYAGYFNRVKQALASVWDPNSALRARDPTGERFAYKDRYTLLAVTLNDQGGLTDVHVVRTSGVDFLDQTTLDAFRKAQPFVNPPRGLADSHGEIRFNFGFFVESGSSFRLFRGPAVPQ